MFSPLWFVIPFSYSWGYRKVYEQFATAIQQKYPELFIEGDNYPPPPLRFYLAQILTFTKMAVMLMIIMGQNPFTYFNMDTPNIYAWAIDNKVRGAIWFWNSHQTLHTSLRPSEVVWWHRLGSTLAQVMACCLTAPVQNLDQCWLIISKIQWHSSQSNFTRHMYVKHWSRKLCWKLLI